MKLKLPNRLFSVMSLFFLCILQTASYGQCSEGINQTFAILNFGSGNVYYNLQSTSGNPNFESANLGSFCPNGTLILEGGQNQVYKCNGADIWQNQIWYRIYLTSASPTGAFTPITEYYQSGYSNGCGGADQTWEANGANINVLSGLSAGTYYLEVYSTADYQYCGSGTIYASNSSYNYRATFTVNATPTITVNSPRICAGSMATLTATGGTSYVWNNDSAKTSITTATAGTYTVTATNSSGCTASASGTVTINPNPTAYAGDDTFVDFVTNVVLGDSTPIGGTAPYTFAWTPGTGLSDSTTQFPICTPLATTKYYLTVTDSNGCKNTDSVIVAFNKGNNPLTDIKYSAQNVAFTDSGQYLEFDVFASDTPTNLLFSQGQIYVSFDTTYFGSHLVTSGAITVSKGQAIDSPYYNLTVVDSTASMIKLSVTHTANPTSLTNLDSVNQQLCHIKLRVASVGTPFANFDSVLMVGQSLYKRSVSGLEFPYDLVQVSGLVGALRSGDAINAQLSNISYTGSSQGYLTFEVQVQSSESEPFADADVTIAYNTFNFGTSPSLNCTTTMDGSYYTLTPSASSGTIDINLSSANTNITYLESSSSPISNISGYTTIATCSLTVVNCCAPPPGSGPYLTPTAVSGDFADFSTDETDSDQANWFYYETGTTAYGSGGSLLGTYDNSGSNICPNSSSTPTITTISAPDNSLTINAGTFSVLTINGSGFGCSLGQVLFPNADDGGATLMHTQAPDIQTWGDDQITVLVPSLQGDPNIFHPAGSGHIQVVSSTGDSSGTSPDALTIPYAIKNIRDATTHSAYPVALKNQNLLGGYTFRPAPYITGDTLAAITKAMNDWVCQIGVQFTMGTDTNLTVRSGTDQVNSIMFGVDSPNVLCATYVNYSYPSPCSISTDTVGTIIDIDMVYNTSIAGGVFFDTSTSDTHVVPAGEASLLGVARHEFGHAVGLFHVLEHTLMFWQDQGPTYPAEQIQAADGEGGIYELTQVGPMDLVAGCYMLQNYVSPCHAIYNGINTVGSNPFNVLVYPNPFNESITIRADLSEAANVKVSIFDVLGQIVAAQDFGDQSGTVEEAIDVSALSGGIYIVRVSINEKNTQVKLIKK